MQQFRGGWFMMMSGRWVPRGTNPHLPGTQRGDNTLQCCSCAIMPLLVALFVRQFNSVHKLFTISYFLHLRLATVIIMYIDV